MTFLVSNEMCSDSYMGVNKIIDDGMLCAVGAKGKKVPAKGTLEVHSFWKKVMHLTTFKLA